MSTVGNILWLVFGGLIAALGYFIGGLALCLTVIGIPFGIQALALGKATLTPFGKKITSRSRGDGCVSLFFNIIWLLLFGWEIALVHVVSGIILCVTVVGIPFGKQHFKLAQIALFPFTFRLD